MIYQSNRLTEHIYLSICYCFKALITLQTTMDLG